MCREKVCYELLDYESKLLQIKTSTFSIFSLRRLHDFIAWSCMTYINQAALLVFDIFC